MLFVVSSILSPAASILRKLVVAASSTATSTLHWRKSTMTEAENEKSEGHPSSVTLLCRQDSLQVLQDTPRLYRYTGTGSNSRRDIYGEKGSN